MVNLPIDNYRELFEKYKGMKSGELIRVILNEEAAVASKRQICLYSPKHNSGVNAFSSLGEFRSYYNKRSENGDFEKLEQLALVGHLPKYNTGNEHHPLINPDIRRELAALDDPWSKLKKSDAGKGPEAPTSSAGGFYGPTAQNIKWGEDRSREAAGAMMHRVGELIAANKLPDEDEIPVKFNEEDAPAESDYFGLRIYLYGQIAVHVSKWSNAEIKFETFERLPGESKDGYRIKGHLEADAFELKGSAALDTDTPTEEVLEDSIYDVLFRYLRYASFNPAGITKDDLGPGNRIPIGQGDFKLEGLEIPAMSARQEISIEDAEKEHGVTKGWFNLLDPTVNVPGEQHPVEFELHLQAI